MPYILAWEACTLHQWCWRSCHKILLGVPHDSNTITCSNTYTWIRRQAPRFQISNYSDLSWSKFSVTEDLLFYFSLDKKPVKAKGCCFPRSASSLTRGPLNLKRLRTPALNTQKQIKGRKKGCAIHPFCRWGTEAETWRLWSYQVLSLVVPIQRHIKEQAFLFRGQKAQHLCRIKSHLASPRIQWASWEMNQHLQMPEP